MPTIELLVTKLLTQKGGKYTFGGKVAPSVVNPKAAGLGMDCSGFIAWASAQCGAALYGDSGSQLKKCRMAGLGISVEDAIRTRGALLFIPSNGAEHVACSLGDGTTIEAHDTAEGIGIYPATVARFKAGALIPGFTYPMIGTDMTPGESAALGRLDVAVNDKTNGLLVRVSAMETLLKEIAANVAPK